MNSAEKNKAPQLRGFFYNPVNDVNEIIFCFNTILPKVN